MLHGAVPLLIGVGVLVVMTRSVRAQASVESGVTNLTLAGFMERVLIGNERAQQKLLEMVAKDRQARGERGVFEPELFGNAAREYNHRENTVQEVRSTFTDEFWEDNNIYQGGIEALVPTGAKIRLGYTLRDLQNNLQTEPNFLFRGATNGEFQTFFGITVSQPLLKNFGPAATMAGIRLAALASDQAYQEYRRQLMITLATAEAAYWNLYLAQEQVRFFQESVSTAGRILEDADARFEVGKSSLLEVREAEAGLALRRSKLGEAELKLYEAAGQLYSLSGDSVLNSRQMIYAVDRPQPRDLKPVFYDSWRSSYDCNPDYLIQRQRLGQEKVRLDYARNQRLPDLSLKGSYGLNGLGETPADSWEDIQSGDFQSWSLWAELRIPLGGGIKTANELAAAQIRLRAARVGLQEVETQIANAMNTAIRKIASSWRNVMNYQTVVEFNQSLLSSAMDRLESGKIESRKVLDIEADLFDSRNSLIEASVQYERALLELSLLEGSLLQKRSVELTKSELSVMTDRLARSSGLTDEQYSEFQAALQREYDYRRNLALIRDSPDQQELRQSVRQLTHPVDPPSTAPRFPESDEEEALRDALHHRMKEVNQPPGVIPTE